MRGFVREGLCPYPIFILMSIDMVGQMRGPTFNCYFHVSFNNCFSR